MALRRSPFVAARLSLGIACLAVATEVGCSDAKITDVFLVVSGDTAGWIVPCGCAARQSGGLLRRGTYVKRLGAKENVVVADAGGAAGGVSEYHRAKFAAILAGEMKMGIDAHNIGASEVALGIDYLRQISRELSVPFVSANVFDAQGKPLAPAYRMVRRGGQNIFLTGVMAKRYQTAELQVRDPQEAVLASLQEASGKYDYAIVLAYLPEDLLRSLATSLPEVDAVVGGPTGQTVAPEKIGPTLLCSATNKGKFLALIDLPAVGKGVAGVISEMDDSLADDPDQLENLDQYYERLAGRDFEADRTGFGNASPPDAPASYRVAGTHACQQCHADDCQQWNGSKHAHAWETLVAKKAHVDPYCQQCHTTSYGLSNGFYSISKSEQRIDVGCESCHGPSQMHVDNPRARTTFVARDQCAGCHDRENSPAFEYTAYWNRITHGAPANGPVGEALGDSPDSGKE